MKKNQSVKIGAAVAIILGVIVYLAVTGANATKSYYVTIQELNAMGPKAYTRNLRVAGNVVPGSITHELRFCPGGEHEQAARVVPGRGASSGYLQG
jgi:cytochrome c-type biogenesis protein CcmE